MKGLRPVPTTGARGIRTGQGRTSLSRRRKNNRRTRRSGIAAILDVAKLGLGGDATGANEPPGALPGDILTREAFCAQGRMPPTPRRSHHAAPGRVPPPSAPPLSYSPIEVYQSSSPQPKIWLDKSIPLGLSLKGYGDFECHLQKPGGRSHRLEARRARTGARHLPRSPASVTWACGPPKWMKNAEVHALP
jgi:hypothetical protein